MTDSTKTYDPACTWCGGTGRRGSKSHAWYVAHPDVVSTFWECPCGASEGHSPPTPPPATEAAMSNEQLVDEFAARHRTNGYRAGWAEAEGDEDDSQPTAELRAELLSRLNATADALSDAELIDAFETTVIHNSRTWDADIQSRIRSTRVELMRRLTIAAAPPSGQVCVSMETARLSRDAVAYVRWGEAYQVAKHELDDAIRTANRAALKGATR